MTDRCTCPKTDHTSLLVQVGAVEPGLTHTIEPTCPEHGNVDAILASGTYTDRRGRKWKRCTTIGCWHKDPHPSPGTAPSDIRKIIERDQHRDVCRGLDSCILHPVPHVLAGRAWAGTYKVIGRYGESRYGDTHAEAMTAAIELARKEER